VTRALVSLCPEAKRVIQKCAATCWDLHSVPAGDEKQNAIIVRARAAHASAAAAAAAARSRPRGAGPRGAGPISLVSRRARHGPG